MDNPYKTPESELAIPKEISGDIDDIKGGQKLIIYAILLNFATFALARVNPVLALLSFVSLGMSIYGLYKLSKGMRAPIWLKILIIILMFVPLLNLITLLVINGKATKILKEAGYNVGLLGAQ